MNGPILSPRMTAVQTSLDRICDPRCVDLRDLGNMDAAPPLGSIHCPVPDSTRSRLRTDADSGHSCGHGLSAESSGSCDPPSAFLRFGELSPVGNPAATSTSTAANGLTRQHSTTAHLEWLCLFRGEDAWRSFSETGPRGRDCPGKAPSSSGGCFFGFRQTVTASFLGCLLVLLGVLP